MSLTIACQLVSPLSVPESQPLPWLGPLPRPLPRHPLDPRPARAYSLLLTKTAVTAWESQMERTLIVLKPDAVQRQLVGRIVHRFEQKGLQIVAMKMLHVGRDLARRMYAPHEGKDFYEGLMAFITSSPVVTMVLEGRGAIAVCRGLMGPTFGPAAPGGTIRGDFGMSMRYNLIHGSDSADSAAREIPLFFHDDEIVRYDPAAMPWVYARSGDQWI